MIEWFHEGAPVLGPQGDDHRIVLPDGSLFFLRALRGIDDGNYWCVASNLNLIAGASSSNRVARSRNATLRVACKPPSLSLSSFLSTLVQKTKWVIFCCMTRKVTAGQFLLGRISETETRDIGQSA